MSATQSLLGRGLLFAASSATRKTALATALIATMALAPVHAQSQTDTEKNDAAQASSATGYKILGGAVGAGAGAGITHLLGGNKYFTAAAGIAGGIFGMNSGAKMAQAQEDKDRAAGLLSPKVDPSGTKVSVDMAQKFEALAINAAAYRLLVQSSNIQFQAARDNLALTPRDLQASKVVLSTKAVLTQDVNGLNVAIHDLQNATDTLSTRYPGSDFKAARVLIASISAPATAVAGEVAPNKPIFAEAEQMALSIRNGQTQHLGMAVNNNGMRLDVAGQNPAYQLNLATSGNQNSAASVNDTLRRLGMRQ